MEDDLIRDLPKGSKRAFEYLVSAYEKKIYIFVYNIVRNPETAKDLTQEVFLKVYKNIYKYNPEYPIQPWLFKIAYNIVLNYLKKNKSAAKQVSLDCNINNENLVYNDNTNFETKDLISREFQSMKPDVRMIMLLRIVEDLSFDQIATILNTTQTSVKFKFYRSRKILINKLVGEV